MKRKTGVVKKSESILQKRPQDFETSVKFDENANVFMQKRPQDFEYSVKVDVNDNVFLE